MKKYTLELTADELEKMHAVAVPPAVGVKLLDLATEARADREADELRLPWVVGESTGLKGRGLAVFGGRLEERLTDTLTPAQAKLMAAAPELLEAVKAITQVGASVWTLTVAQELARRALRKVETGIPG
jgi:hypothetical protein